MDEFEESDLEKKTNDSHNTCYQSAAHKEKRHKNCKYGLFSLVFVIELGGGGIMRYFSFGLQKTDKRLKA